MPIIIRDLRKKEKYQIDDVYLNGYAKVCGIYATGVYNVLCRHADYYTQECFPSIETMADTLGIGIASVKRGLANLVKYGIIVKTRTRHPENNKWVNNSYTLVDCSQWVPHSSVRAVEFSSVVTKNDTVKSKSHSSVRAEPQLCEIKSHSSVRASKESHIKGNTYKDTAEASSAPPIIEKEPMTKEHFVRWCRESPKRYIRIIGEYADEKKDINFSTKDQWVVFIKQNLRAAKKVEPFTDEQLSAAATRIKKSEYITMWNLETLLKFIIA